MWQGLVAVFSCATGTPSSLQKSRKRANWYPKRESDWSFIKKSFNMWMMFCTPCLWPAIHSNEALNSWKMRQEEEQLIIGRVNRYNAEGAFNVRFCQCTTPSRFLDQRNSVVDYGMVNSWKFPGNSIIHRTTLLPGKTNAEPFCILL